MKNIVIFIPAKPFYGATVLLIPFFQNLKAQHPNTTITVFTTTSIINVLSSLQFFNKIVVYKKSNFLKIFFLLRSLKPELIINFRSNSDFLNSLCLFSFHSKKIGYDSNALLKFIYHYKPKRNKQDYRLHDFLRLLENPLFQPHFSYQNIKNLRDLAYEKELTTNSKIQICLMPGGGEGEHKRWGIQNFCALANRLLDKNKNLFFHFVVGHQEQKELETIKENLNANSYLIHMNQEITKILSIVNSSKLTISNDCGPGHLAQMCEGYYIGLWGWRNQNPLERIAEWTLKTEKSFPILAKENEDIKTIPPEMVSHKVLEILNLP